MAFDIKKARALKYSDDEIETFLDEYIDVKAAKKAGYSLDEIAEVVSDEKRKPESAEVEDVAQPEPEETPAPPAFLGAPMFPEGEYKPLYSKEDIIKPAIAEPDYSELKTEYLPGISEKEDLQKKEQEAEKVKKFEEYYSVPESQKPASVLPEELQGIYNEKITPETVKAEQAAATIGGEDFERAKDQFYENSVKDKVNINATVDNVIKSAASATASLWGGLNKVIPETVGMLYLPQNVAAKYLNIPSLKVSYEDVTSGKVNPLKWFDNAAETSFQMAKDLRPNVAFDKDIFDYVKAGQYLKGGEKLWYALAGQIPQYATIIAATLTGNPAAAMGLLGASKVGQEFSEAQKEKVLPEEVNYINSVSKGFTEGIFESSGTGAVWKAILNNPIKKRLIKNGLIKGVTTFLKNSGEEPKEEVLTQISDNVIDILSGKQDVGVLDNVKDAFTVGWFMGAPAAGIQTFQALSPRTTETAPETALPADQSSAQAAQIEPVQEAARPVEQATETVLQPAETVKAPETVEPAQIIEPKKTEVVLSDKQKQENIDILSKKPKSDVEEEQRLKASNDVYKDVIGGDRVAAFGEPVSRAEILNADPRVYKSTGLDKVNKAKQWISKNLLGINQENISKVIKHLLKQTRDGVMLDKNGVGRQNRVALDATGDEIFRYKDKFGDASILILDIGNIGKGNEVFGHEGANYVMKKISNMLDKYVAEEKIENAEQFRQGGDEASIVAYTDKETLERVGKKAQNELEQWMNSTTLNELIAEAAENGVKISLSEDVDGSMKISEMEHPKHKDDSGAGLVTGFGYIDYGVSSTKETSDRNEFITVADKLSENMRRTRLDKIKLDKIKNKEYIKGEEDKYGTGKNETVGAGRTEQQRGAGEDGKGRVPEGQGERANVPEGALPGRIQVGQSQQPTLFDNLPEDTKPAESGKPAENEKTADQLVAAGVLREKSEPAKDGDTKKPESEQKGMVPVETSPFTDFDVPSETLLQTIQRKIQNKMNRVLKVQETIEKAAGEKIPEDIDVALTETVLRGKTKYALEGFEKTVEDPLLEEIKKSGLALHEIEAYLYAKHAKERNDAIKKEFGKENGSGMTDADAEEILSILADKAPELEDIAQKIYEINRQRVEFLVDRGLIKREDADTILNKYKNYVPLKGTSEKKVTPKIGKGFDIRGKEIRRAKGRKSEATNLLANVFSQFSESIVRAEKNEVGKALLSLVRKYPNEKLWTVEKLKYKPVFDENGEVQYFDPKYKLVDEVLDVKEGGDVFLITMKDVPLARAMKNLGAQESGKIIQTFSAINRYIAFMNTQIDIEFAASNLARDIQTAMGTLSVEQSNKIALQAIKTIPSAIKAAYTGEKGKTEADMQKVYQRFLKAGGKITFFGLKDVDQKQAEIIDKISMLNTKNVLSVRKYFKSVADFVLAINGAMETGTRLATFKVLTENGMSDKKAAAAAKDVTVNFEKKGELGSILSALYVFSSSSIQGSTKILKLLTTTNKGRKLMAKLAVAGFVVAEIGRQIGGEDEDSKEKNWDRISEFDKEKNIIMPISGSKEYIKLPFAYGLNAFFGLGQLLNDVAHEAKTPEEASVKFVSMFLNAFMPVGGAGTMLQTLTPTAARPIMDLGINKNFAGSPIKPSQPAFGAKKPESELYFKSAGKLSIKAAKELNKLTGGSEFRSGRIDVSPETIDFMVEFLTGGVGRLIKNSTNTITKLVTGEKLEPREIPFVRRFKGEQNKYDDIEKFYDKVNEIELKTKEFEALRKENKDEAKKFYEENKKIISIGKSPFYKGDPAFEEKSLSRRITELRKRREEFEKRDKKEQAEMVDNKIIKIMKQFNSRFKD